MISPWPLLVALVLSGILTVVLPARLSRGGVLALAAGGGLWWAGAGTWLPLWLALGGVGVALLGPRRGAGVGAAVWLAVALMLTAWPLLQRHGWLWSSGAILALAGSAVLGGGGLVRAAAPGRGLVLALAAAGVALAMLLPGSSLRLGAQGMVVAAAALPLVGRGPDDDGLAWVGAGLLAYGAWVSVLLGALDWTGLWLLPLVGVPWLGAAVVRRGGARWASVAVQAAAVGGVTAAALAEEVWTLWVEGVPL